MPASLHITLNINNWLQSSQLSDLHGAQQRNGSSVVNNAFPEDQAVQQRRTILPQYLQHASCPIQHTPPMTFSHQTMPCPKNTQSNA